MKTLHWQRRGAVKKKIDVKAVFKFGLVVYSLPFITTFSHQTQIYFYTLHAKCSELYFVTNRIWNLLTKTSVYSRAKIEQTYAESLTKLAAKAQKTSKDALG